MRKANVWFKKKGMMRRMQKKSLLFSRAVLVSCKGREGQRKDGWDQPRGRDQNKGWFHGRNRRKG